ncbi:YcnI family copper-binding membrane protein [Pseudoduganella sp. RAF53_2]|uniref:YcnI family copper-binding membrane protein n=1 Tax=unclassified Pseudoduganella TaxID=2637179 RepID=UPI003F9DE6F0
MKRILIAAAALLATSAHAHITLEQKTATAGSYQKLTFRVGHGCKGSPTREITVTLPEGVNGAKPMPKQGWQIKTTPNSVTWTGGPLPDEYYDEFVMQVKLPADTGTRYFKVAQVCEKGSEGWDETTPGGKNPAPALEIQPAAPSEHAHH